MPAIVTHTSLLIALPFAAIWIGIVMLLRLRHKKGLIYLGFFTIFYVYLFKVLDYTIFQFQSLLLLKRFSPNLMLNGVVAGQSLNLVPLLTLTSADLKTSLLNVLLFVPFGFGLPFVANVRIRGVLASGMLLSLAIELVQFLTGLVSGITFRVADINDLIFNTLGALIGYSLFVVFVRACRHVARTWELSDNPLARYVITRHR